MTFLSDIAHVVHMYVRGHSSAKFSRCGIAYHRLFGYIYSYIKGIPHSLVPHFIHLSHTDIYTLETSVWLGVFMIQNLETALAGGLGQIDVTRQ